MYRVSIEEQTVEVTRNTYITSLLMLDKNYCYCIAQRTRKSKLTKESGAKIF